MSACLLVGGAIKESGEQVLERPVPDAPACKWPLSEYRHLATALNVAGLDQLSRKTLCIKIAQ